MKSDPVATNEAVVLSYVQGTSCGANKTISTTVILHCVPGVRFVMNFCKFGNICLTFVYFLFCTKQHSNVYRI